VTSCRRLAITVAGLRRIRTGFPIKLAGLTASPVDFFQYYIFSAFGKNPAYADKNLAAALRRRMILF